MCDLLPRKISSVQIDARGVVVKVEQCCSRVDSHGVARKVARVPKFEHEDLIAGGGLTQTFSGVSKGQHVVGLVTCLTTRESHIGAEAGEIPECQTSRIGGDGRVPHESGIVPFCRNVDLYSDVSAIRRSCNGGECVGTTPVLVSCAWAQHVTVCPRRTGNSD